MEQTHSSLPVKNLTTSKPIYVIINTRTELIVVIAFTFLIKIELSQRQLLHDFHNNAD